MVVKKDEGWAWMVALAAVVAMFLETGIVKSFGVMLPTLREQFSTKTWVIGLGISLAPGIGAIACPFAGALSKRISSRFAVITFGFIATLGIIMGSEATSVAMLMLALLISGFALGAEAVIMSQTMLYFDKYYNLTAAMANSGLSLGIIIMPPLTQAFLDTFGWRGTMLLLAGFNLHLIVCGALLRPITVKREFKHVKMEDFADQTKSDEIRTKYESKFSDDESKIQRQNNTKCVTENIIYYLDLTLFLDTHFMCMLIFSIGSGYCFTGWLIYLVPHAIDLGFKPYQSSFLATIGGFGLLIASILYPIVKVWIPDILLLYITSITCSIVFGIDPLVSMYGSYAGMACISATFAFARGMAIMSVYKLAKDIIKEEKLGNAILWINVAFSFGSILSGFLSGWIFDVTGDFAGSFLILSAVSLLSLCPQIIIDVTGNKRDSEVTPLLHN